MRLPVVFVFSTVVIDSMGIGIVMPVMPDLLREVGNVDLSSAAIWGGVLSALYAVGQFLFSPTLGNLSDRWGRRPVLLVSLFVMAIDYLVMALASTMWMLVIVRIVGGVSAATQTTAGAYMADISLKKDKAQNFGLLGAAFGLGFILGPLLGGLLSDFGWRAPFYAAAVLAFLNLVFGYFVLPETLTEKKRRPFQLSRANPFGAFLQMRKLPGLLPLLVVFLLVNVAFYVYPSTWAYYGRAQFDWDARLIGLSLAAYGLGMVLVQGVLIRVVVPHFGPYQTACAGVIMHLFSFMTFSLLTQTWQVFALMPISVLSGFAVPALQALMSNTVPENAQGELQGAMGSLVAVASIVSPLVMTRMFGYFTGDSTPIFLPAAPFMLAAVTSAVALFVLMRSSHASRVEGCCPG